MMEVRAGRLYWDSLPITEELPTRVLILIDAYLDDVYNSDHAIIDRLNKAAEWECALDPEGRLYPMPPSHMRLPLPDGWQSIEVVNKADIT
jgi:hypothetical protein